MDPQDASRALREAVEHEIRHLAQMISLLETEQDDLVNGRTDRLEALAAEKLSQVRALDLYSARRAALVGAIGPKRAGHDPGAQAAAFAAAGLGELWRRLADRAAEAQSLNAVNGRLIAQRLQSATQKLARLGALEGAPLLYGPGGLGVRMGESSRPLGQV